MIKNRIPLLALFLVLPLFAADRSIEVHSRIQSSLSGFLDSSSFVVLVKKIEDFEDFSQNNNVSGPTRSLPGLEVSVDEEGNLVRKNQESASYQGAVDVTVLLDRNVEEETYATIEELLPELMGSENLSDSILVKRALLRQAPVSSAGNTVSRQPSGGSSPDNNMIKILAAFMAAFGLLLWFLGRRQDSSKTPAARASSVSPRDKSSETAKDNPYREIINSFPENAMALYALLALHEKRSQDFLDFCQQVEASTQKKLLAYLPFWLSEYLSDKWMNSSDSTPSIDAARSESLIRELTLVEKSCSISPYEEKRQYLEAIPMEAFLSITTNSSRHPADTLLNLWNLRSDAVKLFQGKNIQVSMENVEPSKKDIESCYDYFWNFNLANKRSRETPMQRFVQLINNLDSFELIDQQLKTMQSQLNSEDYSLLLSKVVYRERVLDMSKTQLKSWLRQEDPHDLLFFLESLPEKPQWTFESLMRPRRLAMFRDAEKQKRYKKWDAADKQLASRRSLEKLRSVLLNEKSPNLAIAA